MKAILFDIDDTLIKTFETKKEALKNLGRKHYNIVLEDEFIRSHWGKPMKPLLEALYVDADFDDALERYLVEREKYPTSAYEDTLTTLEALSQKYLLGVISSKSKRYLRKDFELSGISNELFFFVQTEEDSPFHKPDPKVFNQVLLLLEEKNIEKKDVLYIGDTLSDFYAARDAGITFYGIADRTTTQKEFAAKGAKTISKLSELLEMLVNT